MIIKRIESWGKLFFETKNHIFTYDLKRNIPEEPFISKPIVLNVDLTFKCNMNCLHCVAKDTATTLGGIESTDLNITNELLDKINISDFLVIVITGGEPFLQDYEDKLIFLIKNLKNKGIIIDTNGTIFPSKKLLRIFQIKNVLIRVSWDNLNPKKEYELRKYSKKMYENVDEYMTEKIKFIKHLMSNNVEIAIQSVMHGKNWNDPNFYRFPIKFNEIGVNKWYIQRFIPSYKKVNDGHYLLPISNYNESIKKLIRISNKYGIECFIKKDRRHNSVFVLVKNGEIYTQSDDVPGKKIYLGKIGEINNYFEFVSSSEHSVRYY